MKTAEEFELVLSQCRDIFAKKLEDYGAAWRILRPESMTDQLYIKANRIRSLEILKQAKVNEGIKGEFIALVNYSIIALIQLSRGFADTVDMDTKKALDLYDQYAQQAKELMLRKNHDYGEAWRQMRISSFTDLILMKIFRIKQIEDNQGQTLISEGAENNYFDIINYSVFALIKLTQNNEQAE